MVKSKQNMSKNAHGLNFQGVPCSRKNPKLRRPTLIHRSTREPSSFISPAMESRWGRSYLTDQNTEEPTTEPLPPAEGFAWAVVLRHEIPTDYIGSTRRKVNRRPSYATERHIILAPFLPM